MPLFVVLRRKREALIALLFQFIFPISHLDNKYFQAYCCVLHPLILSAWYAWWSSYSVLKIIFMYSLKFPWPVFWAPFFLNSHVVLSIFFLICLSRVQFLLIHQCIYTFILTFPIYLLQSQNAASRGYTLLNLLCYYNSFIIATISMLNIYSYSSENYVYCIFILFNLKWELS